MTAASTSRIRYGIGEWYGSPLLALTPREREERAQAALKERGNDLSCPFQRGQPKCNKAGGVCSIQQYEESTDGGIERPVGAPVTTCPKRFEEDDELTRWLAEIVSFPWTGTQLAREVPFLRSSSTGKAAGMIDLVVARAASEALRWYGLEIQAVYFSGHGMAQDFEAVRDHPDQPPFPTGIRRPDWRSSSAKRLMPQLQIKVPTLRRWGSKLAVAVDEPFFNSLGGPSESPSHDLSDGDIIWLVPELKNTSDGRFRFTRGHWEVLTLEESSRKLLAAETMSLDVFEETLRGKLAPPISAL